MGGQCGHSAAPKVTFGLSSVGLISIQCCAVYSGLPETPPETWGFHTRLPKDLHLSGEAAGSQPGCLKAPKTVLLSLAFVSKLHFILTPAP